MEGFWTGYFLLCLPIGDHFCIRGWGVGEGRHKVVPEYSFYSFTDVKSDGLAAQCSTHYHAAIMAAVLLPPIRVSWQGPLCGSLRAWCSFVVTWLCNVQYKVDSVSSRTVCYLCVFCLQLRVQHLVSVQPLPHQPLRVGGCYCLISWAWSLLAITCTYPTKDSYQALLCSHTISGGNKDICMYMQMKQ